MEGVSALKPLSSLSSRCALPNADEANLVVKGARCTYCGGVGEAYFKMANFRGRGFGPKNGPQVGQNVSLKSTRQHKESNLHGGYFLTISFKTSYNLFPWF